MIRRFAHDLVVMMVRMVRDVHRRLNDRCGAVRGAKAGARGMARAEEQRGDRQ